MAPQRPADALTVIRIIYDVRSPLVGWLSRNVLVLRSDGSICDIVPLTRAEISIYGIRLRRPQFVGRNHEWDYNDLLVGENLEEKVDAVVKHLAQTPRDWELVDLIDVRDTNTSAECIQSMASKAGLSCALLPAKERCPYIRIDSGWDEMLSHRLTCSHPIIRMHWFRPSDQSARIGPS